MAQTENGVGISFKLADGTMVWARRDDWAEVLSDVTAIRGEGFTDALKAALQGGSPPPARPVQVGNPPSTTGVQNTPAVPVVQGEASGGADVISIEQAAKALGGTVGQSFDLCPRCGSAKDKLIPAGFSKKTNKSYPAFYACPTNGCPGR